MVVAWVAILSVVVGVCAMYGGHDCKAPKSGPFDYLLHGRKFVPSKSWRSGGCIEVISHGSPRAPFTWHKG